MWHTLIYEEMNNSTDNNMCSLSSVKATFKEYFVNTFYFLLFYPFLKCYQFKIKIDKMNLYKIEHMYFPFVVITKILLNVDHSKMMCEFFTRWTRDNQNVVYNTDCHNEWTPFGFRALDVG